MDEAVHPLDLLRIPEFVPFFPAVSSARQASWRRCAVDLAVGAGDRRKGVDRAGQSHISLRSAVLAFGVCASCPSGACPYRQYLCGTIPSLPRALKGAGYRATAIQVDPKYFFGRERAFDFLGFDEVRWLHEAPGIQRAAGGFGPLTLHTCGHNSEASRQAEPFFIFAFPSLDACSLQPRDVSLECPGH